MAEKDLVINQLMTEKRYFADLFNGGIFDGEQILTEDNLELMPDKSGIIYVDGKEKKKTLRRFRDVIMKASFGTYFAVMACETQDSVHYAMPVRMMLYDALSYTEQVQALEAEHKRAKDQLKGAEFLSGIKKEDRIFPVISIVLFLGKDWDGSKSLYDMMWGSDEQSGREKLRKYLPDYHINLLQANDIEHVETFKTDLQYIFGMLKYNSDKDLLYQYVKDNREELMRMDVKAAEAMWLLLGEQKRLMSRMKTEEGKELEDMCKAIDDLILDGEIRGETRLSELIMTLAKQGRQDLILKAASDETLRKKLYEENNL